MPTDVLIKPRNPAKDWLSRYRFLIKRRDALQRAIDDARERALACTVRLKPIHGTGGGGSYDRMAEDTALILDAEAQLIQAAAEADKALSEILAAIGSLQSEAQKTVLTMRYIACMDWTDIQAEMHYERTQTYIIHGRALNNIKKYLEREDHP